MTDTAGFGGELHGECVERFIINTLAGAVVHVDKADFAFLYRVADHFIAVVLRGDIHFPRFRAFYGLIAAAVAVFLLLRFRAERNRHELVSKPDTHHGRFAQKFFHFGNDFLIFAGIARAVGKHHAVCVKSQNFFRRGACGHADYVAALRIQIGNRAVFRAEIPKRDGVFAILRFKITLA